MPKVTPDRSDFSSITASASKPPEVSKEKDPVVYPEDAAASKGAAGSLDFERTERWFEENANVYTLFLVYWVSRSLRSRTGIKQKLADALYALYVAISVLACGFMQFVLPTALLVDWVHSGDSFWDLFRLLAVVTPATPAPATPVLSGLQTQAPSPPPSITDRIYVVQPIWMRLCKGCVATYVLWLILFRDAGFALNLLHYSAHICRSAVLKCLMVAQSVIYSSITVLVYFVTLVLISRSTTISDTILSGVGALFILEFDEVVGNMFELKYRNRVKDVLAWLFTMEGDRAADAAENGRNGAYSAAAALQSSTSAVLRPPVPAPSRTLHMCLKVMSVCITYISLGFWMYFLYRLQRGS